MLESLPADFGQTTLWTGRQPVTGHNQTDRSLTPTFGRRLILERFGLLECSFIRPDEKTPCHQDWYENTKRVYQHRSCTVTAGGGAGRKQTFGGPLTGTFGRDDQSRSGSGHDGMLGGGGDSSNVPVLFPAETEASLRPSIPVLPERCGSAVAQPAGKSAPAQSTLAKWSNPQSWQMSPFALWDLNLKLVLNLVFCLDFCAFDAVTFFICGQRRCGRFLFVFEFFFVFFFESASF